VRPSSVPSVAPDVPPPEEPWPLSQWSEADLLAFVRRTARIHGWRGYHTRWSLGSDAGFPDLVLARAPRVIFAELKRERRPLTKGRLVAGRRLRWTEGQTEWLAELLGCPVESYWWTPRDLAEIEEILRTGPRPQMGCVLRTRTVLELTPEGGASDGATR